MRSASETFGKQCTSVPYGTDAECAAVPRCPSAMIVVTMLSAGQPRPIEGS